MTSQQVGMDVVRIAADDELEGSGCIYAGYRSVVFLIEKVGKNPLKRFIYFSDMFS